MKRLERNPIGVLVIGILGISMSSIFVKYSAAPSAVTAAFRLCLTVLMLTPAVFGRKTVRKELFSISGKQLLLSILSGVFLAIHFVLWFESLLHTSVASSTTIVCTEVIWVCLGFCIALKGKLTWKAVAAIVITLGGSAIIALSDSGSGSHLYGDILALLGAISVAVYTLLGRVVRVKVSNTVYTYLVYAACAATLVITCLIQGYSLFGYGWSPVIVGLLLAVFSTILGHSIFSWCLKYLSPAFVSASKLCEPVVASLVAIPLFLEIPGPAQIIGGVLILGGVFWYSRLEAKEAVK